MRAAIEPHPDAYRRNALLARTLASPIFIRAAPGWTLGRVLAEPSEVV